MSLLLLKRGKVLKRSSVDTSRNSELLDEGGLKVRLFCICFLLKTWKNHCVATEYIHATPTLRPAYFHFVYVEMSYSRYRSSVNETGIIGTQGEQLLVRSK